MNVFYKPDDDIALGGIDALGSDNEAEKADLEHAVLPEEIVTRQAEEKSPKLNRPEKTEEDEIDLLMKKYGYEEAEIKSIEKRDREYAAEIKGISDKLYFVDGSEYSDDKKGITTVSIKTACGCIGKYENGVERVELSVAALKKCGILSPFLSGEKVLVLDDGYKIGSVGLSVAAGEERTFLFSERSKKFIKK